MNVRRFRLTLERALKHLLGRYILTAVEFDNAAIVKRVSITRQNAFSSQTRFGNCEIRASTSSHLRHLRILVHQNAKLIPRFGKTSARKLFVRAFEGDERR